LDKLIDKCNEFFSKYNARIINHELHWNPQKRITLYVEFANCNFFGNSDICNSIYPIFRKLIKNFFEYLYSQAYNFLIDDSYIFDIIPLLSKNYYYGEEFFIEEEQKHNTSPLEIIKLDEVNVRKKLTLCQFIPEINFAVKRLSDGRIYEIDELYYYVFLKIMKLHDNYLHTIVDIGAASGNIAHLVLNRQLASHLILNDSDAGLCKQLEASLKTYYKYSNIKTEIICADCLDLVLPSKIDILCITVNTDKVVSFLKTKKQNIMDALKDNGILIVGMLASINNIGYGFSNMMVIGQKK